MVHIDIKNFQSIENMSFDIEGFTTLVGRNFIGKSATLMAINAALTNQQGTDFIRWGEKFCEVRIVTRDLDILWHKEKNNNFYVINNQTYKKIGGQPPPDPILQAGFGVTDVAGEKHNLLYIEQFFPLFLVDRKDSKSADLLISIYGLDRLYKAVDLCEKDRKKSHERLKLREGDRGLAEEALQRFSGFENTQKSISDLDQVKIKIQKQEQETAELRTKTEKIIEYTLAIRKLRPVKEIEIPDAKKVKALFSELQDLSDKLDRLRMLKIEITKLREAQSSEIAEDKILEIQEALKEKRKLKSYKLSFESLNQEIEKLSALSKIKISEPKLDFESLNSLKKLNTQTTSCSYAWKQLKAELERTTVELNQIETERSAYDRCPVCGSKLDN